MGRLSERKDLLLRKSKWDMYEKKEYVVAYIREHRDDMYRFAYSCVKNREDALDIIQESAVKAISCAERLKDVTCVKAWIFKIIVNEANLMYRRNKRFAGSGDIEEAQQEDLRDSISEYIDRHDVIKGIMEMEDKYRIVLILRYYEELQIKEISSVLKISQNTVKSRLYKALDILKRKFGVDCL